MIVIENVSHVEDAIELIALRKHVAIVLHDVCNTVVVNHDTAVVLLARGFSEIVDYVPVR